MPIDTTLLLDQIAQMAQQFTSTPQAPIEQLPFPQQAPQHQLNQIQQTVAPIQEPPQQQYETSVGPQMGPAPKEPNFLRRLLTSFVGAIGEDLQSGAFQEAAGAGMQAGTAPSGTKGQAFAAAFGGLPQARESRRARRVQERLAQSTIESREERLKQQQDSLNERIRHQQELEAIQRSRLSEQEKATLLREGYRINPVTQQREPIPEEELPPQIRAKIADLRSRAELRDVQGRTMQERTAQGWDRIEVMRETARASAASRAISQSQRQQGLGMERERLDIAQGRASGNVPTASTLQMSQQSSAMLKHVQPIRNAIQRLSTQDKLGVIRGRWEEFMAGRVGAGDPDFVRLRTQLGLFQTGMMRAHVGARGGVQLMEHFKGLINGGKFTGESLTAALDVMEEWLQGYEAQGRTWQPNSGGNQSPSAPGSIPRYDQSGNRIP